jgi:hypothetical protein
VPNNQLQQTGHATRGFARHDVVTRVSRLLSMSFGRGDSYA